MTEKESTKTPDEAHAEATRAGRRAVRTATAHRRRNVVTLVVLVVALAILIGGAWRLVLPMFATPDPSSVTDYPGPGTGTVEVVVTDPAPEAVAAVLQQADVIAAVEPFVQAYTNNPDASGIAVGSYALPQQMAAADAVTALLDAANRTDMSLTIPTGWRMSQVFGKVAEVLGVSITDVTAAAAQVTLPAEAGGQIEGWLFADTYTIPPGATAIETLQQMVDRTVQVLDERNVAAANRETILIKASIVEAEVSDAEAKGMVARVMENRLAGCADVGPLLQMNSTVAYGLQESITDLTLADLQDTTNAYNTYVVQGLPPSPINSPSLESIDAVLAPPEGTWCYFVTVNLETGETRFTDDPAEHEQNRAEYRAWLAQWLAEQSATPSASATDG